MSIILNIIYFLLGLTVLVSIHEAGHLSMAKLFDVYCDEYSIGFGPAIFTIKPKGMNVKKNRPKETKFSLRCIPLGGFVSMAGEGLEDVEQLSNIPANRFLSGVKKWQRAIIMLAGVVLNAILGLVLLICAYSINTTADYRKDSFKVQENLSYVDSNNEKHEYTSKLLEGEVIIDSDTSIKNIVVSYTGAIKSELENTQVAITLVDEKEIYFVPIKNDDGTYKTIEKKNKKTGEIYVYYVGNDLLGNQVTYLNDDVVKEGSSLKIVSLPSSYSYDIVPGTLDTYGGTPEFMNQQGNSFSPMAIGDTKTYKFTLLDGRVKEITVNAYSKTKVENNGEVKETFAWELVGISLHGRHFTFGEVMSNSVKTFGQYSIAIYSALSKIFTKEGFSSLGGPIAIVQQQMTFVDLGFGYYLLFWGLISINLAVINLLPFPGLDGWHFLVLCVEGITKKEINPKVKSIMSTIGMILLFGLMFVITIKDIVGLF